MLTDLQTAKLTHIFNIIDFDRNGTIEKDDFEAIGENLAIIRDFDYGSPDFDRVMALSLGIWDNLEPHIHRLAILQWLLLIVGLKLKYWAI